MNKYVAQLQHDTGATPDNIVKAGGGSLPAVTVEDDGDVLTVVDGAWGKATPSGGSSILVAEVKYNDSDEPYIDATVAELAAADAVVIKHISAGDPNVPTSEFGVVYGTCELIMNTHGTYVIVVTGDVFFSNIGYNQFVATDASQKPVGYAD